MALHRVRIRGFVVGQTHENVLHFETGESTMTEMDVANSVRDNWLVHQKVWSTSQLVYNSILVQKLVSGADPAPVTLAVNIPGTGAADNNLIPFVCIVVRFSTAIAGKHGRGRIHVGGLPQVAATHGIVTAARLTSFESQRTALMNLFGPTGSSQMRLYVASRQRGEGATQAQVTDITLRPELGSLRRRNYHYGV